MNRWIRLVILVALWIVGMERTVCAQNRVIAFSGYNWTVRSTGDGTQGPGPNYFSNSAENVWLDKQGRLHLKITHKKGRWYSAEVFTAQSLGYGTYRFTLDSAVDGFDPQIVLGLFTYLDDDHEIDIEFAKWGNPKSLNASYTIQPGALPDHSHSFSEPAGIPQSVHSFLWKKDRVLFKSLKGLDPDASTAPIQEWTFMQSGIPAPGREKVHLNLWLFRGAAPSNQKEVEIILRKFEFLPEAP